ncbi:gas vesicle protein gvpo [Desulfoluna butyratoxydans]|uniref:Gas vesicle protein gvpo n=2 Tax=Desulfoluna butyratoxydans TaxID=231438 RepID=A0A4U8YPA5_9BACT|nr:gas vesicle protein gvpo [Desulfoluna butyratoxydans]
MAISFTEAIQKAREELNMLIGLEIDSTVSAEPNAEGWRVTLEAIEKRAIPDSLDILGVYETMLDDEGKVSEFRRVRMRKRIDTDDTED